MSVGILGRVKSGTARNAPLFTKPSTSLLPQCSRTYYLSDSPWREALIVALCMSLLFKNDMVPDAYLHELRQHTMLYPHDTNFNIILEPGKGFGKVTCFEQGCNNLFISLTRRSSSPDGGLKNGLGSLSAYHDHIATHPTHTKCRDGRRRQQQAVTVLGSVVNYAVSGSSSGVKIEQSRLLNAINNSFGTSSSKHATTQRFEPVNANRHVKLEPTETKLLGLVSGTGFTASAQLHSYKASSLMRITPHSAAFYSKPITYTSTRSVLSLIPACTKPGISETQVSRKRLLDVERNEPAQNPLAAPDVKRRKLEEIPANFDIPDHPLSNHATPGNVEAIGGRISAIQNEIMAKKDILNRLRCKKRPTKADLRRIEKEQVSFTSLRRQEDDLNASFPNLSPVKKTLSKFQPSSALLQENGVVIAPPPLNHPFPQQVVLGQPPIASGSSVSDLAGAYGDSEDDNMGVNHHEYSDNLAFGVLQRIGPMLPEIAPLQGYEYFDENGDFYGKGRDTFVGPQAKADDINKFFIEAGNAAQFDGNARFEQALEKLGLQSQYDLLPGMEVALMPHQTFGVAWMIEKEKSRLQGGCLADDMGLGKTVQVIATLVKNRSENPMCKTNLIIVPTALLDQWKLEIELKTNCNLECLIYHGSKRPKRKEDLLRYDVILTTYSTMALEWPDHENEMKKEAKTKARKKDDFIGDNSDDGEVGSKKKQEQGLLFQVEFFRIILDEAQSIRNRRTRTSRAVTDLQATYRWCLTGTPIVNSLVDAYGYLRFLKVRPWYDWENFHRHIGSLEKRKPHLALSRLQAIITTFLLRRMKDTTMDGKRLIELPEKKVSLVKLQFSEEERDIYKMVEAGAQANFNRFLRAGTVLKNYTQVLVLLLRLRQICSHPSLVQEGGVTFVSHDPADDDKSGVDEEVMRARRLVSPEFVERMKAKFKATALQRMEAEKQSADATAEDEECPICFDALTDAVVTPCTHVFCRECIVDVLNTPLVVNPDGLNQYKPKERPCPTCRGPVCAEKLFFRTAFLPSDVEFLSDDDVKVDDDDDDIVSKCKGRRRSRSERSRRIIQSDSESYDDDDNDNMSDFIVEDDEDEEENAWRMKRLGKRKALIVLDSDDEETPEEKEVIFGRRITRTAEAIKLTSKFLPSAKMKYMMERLDELLEEHPDEKTLVVSQWTACLSLVSDYLTERGVTHVKYQGDMNRVKRDQAIRVFVSRDKARVMLMSLKCVGLNLTRANNVISLDLGWSQAIEAQSFDRVHRLGQTRRVVIQRLVISDTVEDRVLAMQERKQQLADGSLGEGSGKKIGRLTVKELANLFGLDHRGRLLEN
ncbi:hypothetical protein J132_10908 [Termitomyces sp. J132]|nr:hypothetical protein J132_10908 [Termitomyces sp. J132]